MYLYFELRKTKEINLRENMRRNSMTVLNLHKEERLKLQANYNHIIDKLEILKDLMEA